MAACFAYYAFARFYTFHQRTFDLALYARLAYGLSRGELRSSLLDQHFFAGHAPFVLWPLGYLGRLGSTVPVLLTAQSIAMAGAALPLYRAGRTLGGPVLGLGVACAYLLHPNLFLVATYEFHPGNLALPALGHGLWIWTRVERQAPATATEVRRAGLHLTGAVLWVLSCRADFGLLTALLALTVAVRCRSLRLWAAGLSILSVIYVAAMVLVIQPTWARGVGSADLHFGPWGGGPLGIVRVAFEDPQRVLQHFGTAARLTYPLRVMGPLLFLPCLSPWALLIAAPIFAINLISVFPTTTELYSHYLTPALPALAVGAARGAARLRFAAQRFVVQWLPLWVAGWSVVCGGAPWSLHWSSHRPAYAQDRRSVASRELLAHLSSAAAVQAPDPLLPHLAERPRIYRAPPPDRRADQVVLDVSHRQRYGGTAGVLRTTEEPLVRAWLARTDYAPLGVFGPWLALQRGLALEDSAASKYFTNLNQKKSERTRPLGPCLALEHVQWTANGVRLVLRSAGPCPSDLALRIQIPGQWSRVDLLFDGLLSTARLRSGDRVWSDHFLPKATLPWSYRRQLHVSLICSHGSHSETAEPAIVPLLERF